MTSAGRDRLAGFASEDRLLLECSRIEIDAAGAERIAGLLAGPLDWHAVLVASVRHGVAPLMKHGLEQIGMLGDRVPESVAGAFDTLYDNSARRNRRLFAALGDVVARMRADGAEPVGLKDVQLAVEVFGDPALRPMGDIDLLVRRSDWGPATAALRTLGFMPRPGADVPYILKYGPAQHFRRTGDEIWIDLQWNVMLREWDFHDEGRFTYDGLGMWERAVPMKLDGYELRVPTLEDMLFHLCLHLEGHLYSELVLFCDIAELLRQKGDELRWETVLEITRGYQAESSLYYVLLLCERLLGAPVPPDVLAQLAPPYFHGGLLVPLFGNLTPLHFALDEIRLAVSPPQQVMDELERVARRQSARARTLQAEIDRIALGFRGAGGRVFVVDGEASMRLFPDPSPPAFEPVHVYVLKDDLPLLEPFVKGAKSLPVVTADPVLAGERVGLQLLTERSADLCALLSADDQGLTNARSAWRSLRDRIGGRAGDDSEAVARLIIHPLTADELIVVFAAKLGSATENRLFTICGLLEVLRGLAGDCNPVQIAQLAREHGVQEQVSAGLLIAAELADDVPAAPLGAEAIERPKILEWARYGPSSLRRYPWLRRAYYFAFALLASSGARTKLRYLRDSLRSSESGNGKAVLPGLVRDIAGGAVRAGGASEASLQDMAHWLEPDTAGSIERTFERVRNGQHHNPKEYVK